MNLTLLPAPRRALDLCRIGVVVAMVLAMLFAAAGLAGVYRTPQVFDYESGQATGGEFKLGTYAEGHQQEKTLVSDSAGNTMLVTGRPVVGTVPVEVPEPSIGEVVKSRLAHSIVPLTVLVMLAALLRVLRSVKAGDPFAGENIRRLNLVAGLIFLMPVVGFVAALLNESVYNTVIGVEQLRTSPPAVPGVASTVVVPGGPAFSPPDVTLFGVGLIVLAVVQVFTIGHQVKDDTRGLV